VNATHDILQHITFLYLIYLETKAYISFNVHHVREEGYWINSCGCST